MPKLIHTTAIHPTAIVSSEANISADVSIGAYSIIDKGVEIQSGTTVGSHVVINGPTIIGHNNQIFQFSSIGEVPQDKKYRGEDTQLIIGDNNVIREFVTLNRGTLQGGGKTVIGNDNLIMAYVHVAHDCLIGNQNILANNVALAGHVCIQNAAILGGFSLIHQFCTIGSYAFTAMNSVISKDIPPYLMISSLNSKPRGLNLEGLKRHNFPISTIRLLKDAYNLLYRSSLKLDDAIEKISEIENKLPEAVPELSNFIYFLKNHLNRGVIR